jgi:hypothetical protein
MGAVAVDPANSSVVFAGTGEDNSCIDCFAGAGVLESTNGGTTWAVSNPGGMFTNVNVSSIVVEPGAASLATTEVLLGTTAGLYISTDGGVHWQVEAGPGWTNGPNNFTNVTSIVINPDTTPFTIYAAVQGVGIEISANNGSSWTVTNPVGSALASDNSNPDLAIAPGPTAAATTLYASFGSAGNGYLGLYKSTNGGSNWSQLTSVPFFTSADYGYHGTNDDGGGDQSWYDNVLAIDPNNPNILVAAGITAVETTDGGATWTNLDGGGFFQVIPVFHPDFHALTFDSGGDLFIGNDGGVWKLPAADVTTPTPSGFVNLNSNLDITQFYATLGSTADATSLFGGSQDNGTNLYTGSTTWSQIIGGDGGASVIDPSNRLVQYGEEDISVGGDLFGTADGWSNIVPTTNPCTLTNTTTCNWAPPLTEIPGSPGPTLLFGADLVLKSTDGGNTWAPLGSATSMHGTGPTDDVSAIAVAPGNPSVLYAGFDNGALQMSTTGGSTWTQLLSSNNSGDDITDIAVSPTDPFSIYVSTAATFNGFPEFFFPPSVLFGTHLNTAPSFTNETGNLPTGIPTTSVTPDGAGGAFAADDAGVFWAQSLNGGATSWAQIGTGLPHVQVTDLVLTASGTLLAETHGRGAWSLPGVLAVTTPPPSAVGVGQQFMVGVAEQTALGTPAWKDTFNQVSLAITPGTGTPGASLSCAANPVTVSRGTAQFQCSINTAGTGYTLTATPVSGADAPVTTASITVSSASVGGILTPLAPARVLDTRNGTGVPAAGPVAAHGTVQLAVLGQGGVPAAGVAAVVLNVTVTSPTAAGFITVYPGPKLAQPPTASNLNFSAGETIPNLVVARVGSDGKVDLFNGSAGTVHLVADVSGWFGS